MATILRGKNKGKNVQISQWCNNWVSTKCGKILGISNLLFTDEEMQNIILHKNNGYLFGLFEIVENENRFKKRRKKYY